MKCIINGVKKSRREQMEGNISFAINEFYSLDAFPFHEIPELL